MTNEKVHVELCTDVMAGTHWQHRNGNKYEVLFLANVGAENDDTNDYETTVVYRGENGKLWTRPLSDWSRSMSPLDEAAEAEALDNSAVDLFAVAMKKKLAEARAKGRSGWDGAEDLRQHLSDLLRHHVEKGDPRDVANLACFLWNRGESIAPQRQGDASPEDVMHPRYEAGFKAGLRFHDEHFATPQVSGGGERMSPHMAKLWLNELLEECDSTLHEYAYNEILSALSTPQARPDGGEAGKVELSNDLNATYGNTNAAMTDHLWRLGYRKRPAPAPDVALWKIEPEGDTCLVEHPRWGRHVFHAPFTAAQHPTTGEPR